MAFRVARAFFWLAAPSWSCAPAGCSKVTMTKKLTSCNDTLRRRDSIQPLLLIDCTNGDVSKRNRRFLQHFPLSKNISKKGPLNCRSLSCAPSKNISKKRHQHRDLSATLRSGRDDKGGGSASGERGC